MTSGLPCVNVPVLSKAIALISLKVWTDSPLLIKMPLLAPIPLPTINAVGVPSPRAQGQAMTRTAVAVTNAKLRGL